MLNNTVNCICLPAPPVSASSPPVRCRDRRGVGARRLLHLLRHRVRSVERYLPGVTMTVTNAQSGAKHEIRSDRTGHFEFVAVRRPGRYSLQAILPGFSVLTGTLDLTGRDLQRDVTLKIGELEETISVWANMANAPARPVTQAAPRPRPDKAAMMQACSEHTPQAGSMGGTSSSRPKPSTKSQSIQASSPPPEPVARSSSKRASAPRARSAIYARSRRRSPTSKWRPAMRSANGVLTPDAAELGVAIEVPMKIHVSFRAHSRNRKVLLGSSSSV